MRSMDGGRHVVVMARDCGLFSLFTQVLTAIDTYPHRRIAVFFNDSCLYWVPHGWNGSRNAWEYYFEPLSDVHVPSLLGMDEERAMHARIPDVERLLAGDPDKALVYIHLNGRTGFGGVFSECDRPYMKRIIDEHIRVKPVIQRKADAFHARWMSGRRVVGLHYRGTDKYREISTCVPAYIGAEERRFTDYLDAVERMAPCSSVYLATDSRRAVEEAEARLGDRLLCHHDWIRSGDERPVHIGMDKFTAARQGEEAVIDWLLLSRCSLLVHGVSNFSAAVLFAAPDLPHYDLYWRWPCA